MLSFFFTASVKLQPLGLSCCRVLTHFHFMALLRFRGIVINIFFCLKTGLFEIWLNSGQALLLLCLAVSEVGEEVEGESGEEDAGGGNYPTEVQRKK